MRKYFSKGVLVAAVGATLLLSGCATTEDVQKAQSTADQALSAAQQAQQSASSAQQTADQARAGVSELNQRVDGIQQDVNMLKSKHKGQRG
jgi:outer membrane murein-binding lipoprotein Lpp